MELLITPFTLLIQYLMYIHTQTIESYWNRVAKNKAEENKGVLMAIDFQVTWMNLCGGRDDERQQMKPYKTLCRVFQ